MGTYETWLKVFSNSPQGMSVLELQKKLPNARVVYSSATGATEPKNMAYMTRLGLWGKGTTFNDFNDFIQVWVVAVGVLSSIKSGCE